MIPGICPPSPGPPPPPSAAEKEREPASNMHEESFPSTVGRWIILDGSYSFLLYGIFIEIGA